MSKDLSSYLKPPTGTLDDFDDSMFDSMDLEGTAAKQLDKVLADELANKVEASNVCEGGGCTI